MPAGKTNFQRAAFRTRWNLGSSNRELHFKISQPIMATTFLEADWSKLLMINYEIDPKVLQSYVPPHTELDLWKGKCYVSLIGFMFLNTKLKGFRVPFHTNFEEVNLRFYVRHNHNGVWKRGAVFIKENVPKHALTLVANTLYGEKYETVPMSHNLETHEDKQFVEYRWKKKGHWNRIKAMAGLELKPVESDSIEEFISEHYWGYTRRRGNKTAEFGVEHPKWDVYEIQEFETDVNFEDSYGPAFGFLNSATPAAVFLAEGSAIKVMSGRKIG